MTTFKIVRFSRKSGRQRVVDRGLTLDEAQRHCSREDTHKRDKSGDIVWFDGYTAE